MTIGELIGESIVIDTHLDLLLDVARHRAAGETDVIRRVYLPSFKQGGLTCVVSSLYVDATEPKADLEAGMAQLAAFYAELSECEGEFFLATCADDIRRAKRENKLAVMLAFEGAEPMAGNPDMLRVFYNLGVRMLGLCWSRPNWAADGSRFFEYDYVGYGLTESGVKLVDMAREMGVLIDLAHINDVGFDEVMRGQKQPVIATHTCARALSNTPRNINDAQIAAIGSCGGVIGINCASLLVNVDSPESADMEMMVRHMQHEKAIAGAQSLCIGFDQCDRLSTGQNRDMLRRNFDVVPSHAMLPQFVEALLAGGFTQREVKGILGANALRVIEQVIG